MKIKRIQEIEDYIHIKGTVGIDDLCDTFQVSKNTIRRDINKITEKGTIKKVYGGVVSLNNNLLPFENRDVTFFKEKEEIARKAASFIENNDLIYVDSGTTTRYIAEAVDPSKKITIITNNLNVINSASDMENFTLILMGSTFKQRTKSFVNVENWEHFEKFNITKAFMAATAVSLTNGVSNSDFLEYDIKKHVMAKAQKKYLLVDHSKFNHSAMLTYSNLKDFNYLITDRPLPDEYCNYCHENEIQILDQPQSS